MSAVSRVFAASAAALCALALAGCAADAGRPADLSARSSDPQGLISGLPASGEAVCLAATADRQPVLDLQVRRALADRGYRVLMLAPGEVPSPKRCRFLVTVTGGRTATPADLPDAIELDYFDLYTGESQRAKWRREANLNGWRRASALQVQAGAPNNPLLSVPAMDCELIVRNLVDRLFPAAK